MKIFILLLLLSLTACSSKLVQKRSIASELEITEINPNQWTALAKKNMLGLVSEYNLEPYLYTKKIKSNQELFLILILY